VLAPGVDVQLVRVPAGEFTMGASLTDPEAEADERPQHLVYLDEYLIARFELTTKQWRTFVNATGYACDPKSLIDPDDRPARWVSWEDAQVFCAWATQVSGRRVRLPTEAEWEKAARGTDARMYPWGNNPPFCLLCNLWTCVNESAPVGSCSPYGDSVYGCADMSGNLKEAVQDRHSWDYYKVSPYLNPTGPTDGWNVVARGGAWSMPGRDVRSSNRHTTAPTARDQYDGFRIAVTP
jgi:formylglycine-generating enzyme required for sulfatase activity